MSKVRDEFYVNLKGKLYPLYAGVLVAAHEAGLVSLETEILQYPQEANKWSAVVRATATLDGGDGKQRIYSDIGDCSPANTTPQIALASLRMASTRAKGRALRDAIALGETLLEEMPDEQATQPMGADRATGRAAVVPHPPAERAPLPPSHDIAIRHAPECSICSVPLKPSVYEASMKRFERAFCVACGKAHLESQRAAAEAAAAD